MQCLQIFTKERLLLALVGKLVFWSSYKDEKIYYYNIDTQCESELNLPKYMLGKKVTDMHIYLKECLPHQLIKTSDYSKLKPKAMLRQS